MVLQLPAGPTPSYVLALGQLGGSAGLASAPVLTRPD